MPRIKINEDKIWATARVIPGSSVSWGKAGTGNEYLRVYVELLDGPYSGWRGHWDGFFTSGTEERTVESLRIAGWQGDDLETLTSADLDGAFEAAVERDTDKDDQPTKYHSVNWINELGGGGMAVKNELPETDLRMLSARLRARAAAIRKRPPAPIPEPQAPAEQPAGDYEAGGYAARQGDYGGYAPAGDTGYQPGGGTDGGYTPTSGSTKPGPDDDLPF